MLDELDLFDFDDDLFESETTVRSEIRYMKAKKSSKPKKVKYKYAQDLANDIDFKSLDRVYCVVDGSFIFGDFIEAFVLKNNIKVTELTIETLSMSQENIDSLHALIDKQYVDKLDIVVSDFFYSHERNSLIPYIYDKLDIDNKFQLAVCRTHRKICKLKTSGGKHIVIHGSANLRSSDNLESFWVEDCKDLYDFDKEISDRIIERYKTINKSIKSKELWHLVATKEDLKEQEAALQPHREQTQQTFIDRE